MSVSEPFSVPFLTLIKLCYTKVLESSRLAPGLEAKSSSSEITNLTLFTVNYHLGGLVWDPQDKAPALSCPQDQNLVCCWKMAMATLLKGMEMGLRIYMGLLLLTPKVLSLPFDPQENTFVSWAPSSAAFHNRRNRWICRALIRFKPSPGTLKLALLFTVSHEGSTQARQQLVPEWSQPCTWGEIVCVLSRTRD